jgi:hypothetical protein
MVLGEVLFNKTKKIIAKAVRQSNNIVGPQRDRFISAKTGRRRGVCAYAVI